MRSQAYPWQTTQWQQLATAYAQHTLPHALLLTGMAGLGKQHFAEQLARLILCSNPSQEKLFDSHNHPDYYFLQPEEESKHLKIDVVRELMTDLQQTAQQGTYKVAVLSADQLNIAAANCLLKTLEEPTRDTIIILLSSEPERLLATVRSRCQKINFIPSWSTETQSWLSVQGIEHPLPWLNLAEGAPLRALQYAQDETLKTQYNDFFTALNLFWQQGDLINTVMKWQKLEVIECITWLWCVYLDLLRLFLNSSASRITHESQRNNLLTQVSKYSILQLLNIINIIQKQLKLLRQHTNLNLQLQLESLLIEIENA